MPLPVTFATLPAGNEPLALIDTQFAAVGALGGIPCTASGANSIILTPFTNTPTVSSYPDLAPSFVFVAAGTSTGAVTINVNGIGARSAYKYNGQQAIGSNDIVSGFVYRATPLQALNGGLGGFVVDAISNAVENADLSFFIDGGGSAITTGIKVWAHMPFAAQITSWHLMADQTGSVVLDVLRSSHAFPSVSLVGSGNFPTLSSAQSAEVAVSGWTSTNLLQGDFIGLNVTSANTLTKLAVALSVNRQ